MNIFNILYHIESIIFVELCDYFLLEMKWMALSPIKGFVGSVLLLTLVLNCREDSPRLRPRLCHLIGPMRGPGLDLMTKIQTKNMNKCTVAFFYITCKIRPVSQIHVSMEQMHNY